MWPNWNILEQLLIKIYAEVRRILNSRNQNISTFNSHNIETYSFILVRFGRGGRAATYVTLRMSLFTHLSHNLPDLSSLTGPPNDTPEQWVENDTILASHIFCGSTLEDGFEMWN